MSSRGVGDSKVIVKVIKTSTEFIDPNVKASKILLQNAKGYVKIIGLDDEEIYAEEIIVSPDGGWGWMVVLASFMSNLFVDGMVFSFGLISEKIKQTIKKEEKANTQESEIAWVLSLLTAFYCLAGPIGSVLANKYGFRVVATIGSVIASSSFALTYLTSRCTVNLTAMYITCGVMGGTGLSLLYTPSVLAVGFYFEKRRALATSICLCGSGVGQFIFGSLTFRMINQLGWRITILIEAGILLACSIFTVCYRPLRPTFIKPTTKAAEEKSENVMLLNTRTKEFSDYKNSGDIQVTEQLIQLPSSSKTNDGEPEKLQFGHSVLAVNVETGALEVRPEADIESINKPLNRDDIYYTGSLNRIPAYAETVGSGNFSRHAWSAVVSRRYETRALGEPTKNTRLQNCIGKLRALTNLMDFTLLAKPSLALYLLAVFLTSFGFFAPYTYLLGVAKRKGLKESDASVFISVIGASNTVGRIICGVFADMRKVHPFVITGFALITAGTATAVVPFLENYWMFFLYSLLFGFSIAFHVSLFTINLVEIVGLDHLTSAFGLLVLAQGIAFLFGNPLAGTLCDLTGNYNTTFWLLGSLMAVAGTLLFPTLCIYRHEKIKMYQKNPLLANMNQ